MTSCFLTLLWQNRDWKHFFFFFLFYYLLRVKWEKAGSGGKLKTCVSLPSSTDTILYPSAPLCTPREYTYYFYYSMIEKWKERGIRHESKRKRGQLPTSWMCVIMEFSAEHEHRAKTLLVTKQRIGLSLGPKCDGLPVLGMVTWGGKMRLYELLHD